MVRAALKTRGGLFRYAQRNYGDVVLLAKLLRSAGDMIGGLRAKRSVAFEGVPHREREQAICSRAMRCGVSRLWAGRVFLWASSPLSYLAAPATHPVELRARIGSCRFAPLRNEVSPQLDEPGFRFPTSHRIFPSNSFRSRRIQRDGTLRRM